jgi:hypothetical protein
MNILTFLPVTRYLLPTTYNPTPARHREMQGYARLSGDCMAKRTQFRLLEFADSRIFRNHYHPRPGLFRWPRVKS